jgi:ABC-type multidrug transport system ATPase subunit
MSEKPWIEGWNWQVRDGEFWVLGGMAGAGKTELISVAAGLNKPLKGLLRLFGKEVQQLEPEAWLKEKLKLGIVFEDGGRVFQDLSVYDNLMLPLSYHELADSNQNHSWVTHILEMMGMSSMSNRLAGRLSRNWRQRLGLARAIALRPEVLFLDNPLGVVDSHHGQWWLAFLDELVKGNGDWKARSVVVTASDLTPWIDRVNRIALIQERKWKEMDSSNRDSFLQNDLIRALSTGIKQTQ